MVTYFLNWMGPINKDWIETHGSNWSAGRIDVSDDSKEGYEGRTEYSIPLMDSKSWNRLSDWLWDLKTEEVVGYYRLIEMFEQQTRHSIEWYKEPL